MVCSQFILRTVTSFLGLLLVSMLCINQRFQLGVIQPAFLYTSNNAAKSSLEEEMKCDFFDGKWVYDPKSYPLYRWDECPFLDAQVTCKKNGRPDSGYEHWRWEAKSCKIPRFNATYMLERLRGKRLALIGDSLNRNQWESLICLLYPAIRPSRANVKGKDNNFVFRAMDYDFSVEFFWSPFLVRLDEMKNGSKVLKLEELSKSASEWRGADVLVFNTGHWWTHSGKLRSWNYYEHKGRLMDMENRVAFEIALRTWAQWIDREVDPMKTTIFFRSFSPEHKRENLQWCYNQTRPIDNERYVQSFPRHLLSAINRTIKEMKTPVTYLNITTLSEARRDAHTSVYTVRQWKLLTKEQREKPRMYADCSHWCLPGLPDTWNILFYASLFGTPSGLS